MGVADAAVAVSNRTSPGTFSYIFLLDPEFRAFGIPMSRFLHLFLVLFLLTRSVYAASDVPGIAQLDGDRLLKVCESAQRLIDGKAIASAEREDAQLCIGFVEGFVWGHGWEAWRRGADMYFCLPEGFGYRQGVPAVTTYLRAHPERHIQRAHLLLFSALSSAYPCTP